MSTPHTTSPASHSSDFRSAEIDPNSWTHFVGHWNNEMVLVQYAQKVLGKSTIEAYAFPQSEISPELRSKIKSWHYQLVSANSVSDKQDSKIFAALFRVSQESDPANLDPAIQSVCKMLKESADFNKIRHAAWGLTTGDAPLAGLIIGSAMLTPKEPGVWSTNPQHPKDGEALIRQALRIIEESPELSKQYAEIIAPFRVKYPEEGTPAA